ncbi:hypothetical protein ruthe_00469 [Rubellimicrobium thermophilum DSM 16684]|uniref:CENP-V/GFA domain-containing protein n=1 Tax=Rubellimicrobium thermophilum DSM 16684 TaxID=1123069 RepID=S9SLV0_9RHOB|nr:GFA family protein [Rubellimicrobium thermophilum]EPX87399.1 hypothetical protein ruthe_00469 [Rubellimicrobium thermophilum DSM 16684]
MSIQTYGGSCQCGAVRFSADLDLDRSVICNCSRCRRMGFVLAFAPIAAFRLESGEDATTEYRFNRGVIAHRFCRVCGVEAYATGQGPDGTPMVAVNVNCLDGVDPRALTPGFYDGASV